MIGDFHQPYIANISTKAALSTVITINNKPLVEDSLISASLKWNALTSTSALSTKIRQYNQPLMNDTRVSHLK